MCNATVSEDQCFYRKKIEKNEPFLLEIQKKDQKKHRIRRVNERRKSECAQMNYCDQWREKRVVGEKETEHDAFGGMEITTSRDK